MRADACPPSDARAAHRRLSASCATLLAVWLAGCTSTVTPPANPVDPITIYLVQEASHVGLVFPDDDGSLTEYGFGDWDWYATMHNRWYHVFDTILWPTSGTLGFRRFGDMARFTSRHPASQRSPIRVPGANAGALLAAFASTIERGADDVLYNDVYGMTFVPAASGYWFGYNCYDAVSEWLRALDCGVSWVPIRLGLDVAQREQEPEPEQADGAP